MVRPRRGHIEALPLLAETPVFAPEPPEAEADAAGPQPEPAATETDAAEPEPTDPEAAP